ncbi:hypothetical protein AX16_004899 [Volvariella volvacea WC 439]|nr:hypothetical protein AX16_004899 [Volvariella volvacea WC 439]
MTYMSDSKPDSDRRLKRVKKFLDTPVTEDNFKGAAWTRNIGEMVRKLFDETAEQDRTSTLFALVLNISFFLVCLGPIQKGYVPELLRKGPTLYDLVAPIREAIDYHTTYQKRSSIMRYLGRSKYTDRIAELGKRIEGAFLTLTWPISTEDVTVHIPHAPVRLTVSVAVDWAARREAYMRKQAKHARDMRRLSRLGYMAPQPIAEQYTEQPQVETPPPTVPYVHEESTHSTRVDARGNRKEKKSKSKVVNINSGQTRIIDLYSVVNNSSSVQGQRGNLYA